MKKGFTLIELLAVIVILAIVAITTVPLITNVINHFKKAAYEESMRNIFNIIELYIATNEFQTFPSEGVNVNDLSINIKNKNFTTGRIILNEQGELELEKVGNDEYCASGTIDKIIITEGSCDQLDITAPNLSISLGLVMSNAITVVATATDADSGIRGYQYSIDNGTTWTPEQVGNTYTFNGLIMNTSYTIKVRVYNNNKLLTTSDELVVETNELNSPIYSSTPSGWSQSKVVTITYPAREIGYVYEYSLDNGSSWEEVLNPVTTKEITFNANGSIIARISDGINIINGVVYEVTNIDTNPPFITVNPTTVSVVQGNPYTDSGVTATDAEMGDLTSSIIKTGSVNTSVVGTYTLTYNVSDEAGNTATSKTRTVNVVYPTFALNTSINQYITIGSSPLRATASGNISLYQMGTSNFIYVQADSSMFNGYMPEKTEVKFVVEYINSSGGVIESRDVILHPKGTSWSDWTIEWYFPNWGSFPKTSLLMELGTRPLGTTNYKIYFAAQHDSYNSGLPYKNLILNTTGYVIPTLQKYTYNYSVSDYRHWFWFTGSANFSSQFVVYRDMNYKRLLAYSADTGGNVPRGINNSGDGDYSVQLFMAFNFDGKRHSWYGEKYNYGRTIWEVGKIDYDNFGSGMVTLEHASTPPSGASSVYYEYNNQSRSNLVSGTMD